jgi:hypothetical protein
MKAVLVATVYGDKKLFYVVDAKDEKTDGVLDDGVKPKVVNFWATAMNAINLVPLRSTKFHDFLWDGASWDNSDEWERVFIRKTQVVSPRMSSGVVFSSDAMKSKVKEKSINHRATEFKTLMQTQNINIVRSRTGKQ